MPLHRSVTLLWIALSLAASVAGAVTVEQIPSPRPSGWTVDLTGSLPASTVAELNRLGDDVKARTGAELAVVVVGSTDGAGHRDFATRLFNRWGIGERGKDNGLLVFAALDDRAAEIVLGNGIDGDGNVRESEAIMQGVMVPRFRQGDPAGAVLQGAQACARRILDAGPVAESPAPETDWAPQPAVTQPAVPAPAGRRGADGWVALLLGALGLGGAGAAAAFALRPRKCRSCQTKMTLMDEALDDAHLDRTEQAEERVGSVDHQIWVCPGCGQTEKARRSRWFSGYRDCPQCRAKTLKSTSTTVRAATYTSGGLIRVDQACANCTYTNTYTQSTPRRQRSSSRSSSGFGGGRSSGRGASGRW